MFVRMFGYLRLENLKGIKGRTPKIGAQKFLWKETGQVAEKKVGRLLNVNKNLFRRCKSKLRLIY